MHQHFFAPASLFALLILFALAATARPVLAGTGKENTYKIDRLALPRRHRSHKHALKRAYLKHRLPIDEDLAAVFSGLNEPSRHHDIFLTSNATHNQTGTIGNHPTLYDVEYITPITIAGQALNMDFDTGSADLWAFSTALPPSDSSGHALYNFTASSTFKQMAGSSFSISYGDGSSASGNIVGTDIVNIGGLAVANQVVEAATQLSGSFVADPISDGLVGFAFDTINRVTPTKAQTFFQNAVSSLTLPVMVANLRHSAPGSFEFGYIDQSLFLGELSTVAVDSSQGYWGFTSATFSIGDGPVYPHSLVTYAIADTGTTLLLMDPSVVSSYYNNVTGAAFDVDEGGFVFPCNVSPPSLSISLGPNYTATIPSELMSFVAVPLDEMALKKRQNGAEPVQYCYGALQSNGGSGIQILGDPLFKSQIAVFDIVHQTIGFAPHAM